jgi:hypothetical protein
LLVFLLLLVNYTEPEVDFVGLFEVRLHAHDLREGLFGMLKRSIAIVENANAIPKFRFLDNLSITMINQEDCFGYLRVPKVVQGLLVRRVGLLQIVHHQITVAYGH